MPLPARRNAPRVDGAAGSDRAGRASAPLLGVAGALALLLAFGLFALLRTPPAPAAVSAPEERTAAPQIDAPALTSPAERSDSAPRPEQGTSDPHALAAPTGGEGRSAVASEEARHTVAGRVVNGAGAPVTAFHAQLFFPNARARQEGTAPPIEPDAAMPPPAQEFETPDGRFELEGVPAGEWILLVWSPDESRRELVRVRVPEDPDVEVVLRELGRLTGFVRDPFGAAVPGAKVVGRDVEATTDAEGRFEVVCKEVQLSVHASAAGYGPSEPLDVTVVPESVVEVELTLLAEAILRGLVLDAEGRPEPERSVHLSPFEDRRGNGRAEATTAADGRFEFLGLPPGTYLAMVGEPAEAREGARAFRAEQVVLAAGQQVEITLGGAREVAVELTVRASYRGRPAEGRVYVFPTGAGFLAGTLEATLDASGTAVVPLPAAGTYAVRAQREGSRSDTHRTQLVEVPEEPTFTVEMVFEEPASLSGHLLGVEDTPGTHYEAVLYRDDSTDPTELGEPQRTGVEADGSFRFGHLAAGTYTLSVTGALPIQGIRVAPGQDHGPYELEVAGLGRADVRVTDAEGAPAAQAQVFARSPNGAWFRRWGEETERGRASFEGLAPGSYTFLARSGAECSAESAPVQVGAKGRAEVELQLSAGALVRVSLVDGTGRPLEAVQLRLFDDQGLGMHGPSTVYDMQLFLDEGFRIGGGTLGPVAPGPYRVEAVHPNGHVTWKDVELAPGWNEVTLTP